MWVKEWNEERSEWKREGKWNKVNKGKKRGQELPLRLTSGLNVQGLQGYDYEFVCRVFCLITNEHNVEKRKRGSFVIKKHTGSLF